MHGLLLPAAFTIRDHRYVHVQYVQSMWVFGPCAWVRLCGLEAMEGSKPRADSGPLRFRARCQGSQGNMCGHSHTHTRTHTMSSDLEGHLLRLGSPAVRAQSGSKVSPRQPHRIIPFHLIPSTNCAQCDWPVSPGALRRRLRRCLLTLCVSYGSECVGGERVAH